MSQFGIRCLIPRQERELYAKRAVAPQSCSLELGASHPA
jgi:hypothetical protein